MPIQAPQWTEFLTCPVCTNEFNEDPRLPVSLGCGHTICKLCLSKLSKQLCPCDQTAVHVEIDDLPVNHALLQLVLPDYVPPETVIVDIEEVKSNQDEFNDARKSIEMLAQYLVPLTTLPNGISSDGISNGKMMSQMSKSAVIDAINNGTTCGGLTRPMQRKLVTLISCQLVEEEGRCRAVRAARSLGERTVKELILLHQSQQHLSTNLWTAVRNRGCQFLGPALQEEILKLILLALEDGNSLTRKVLVLFVVQRLESKFTQASKTSIGHVVQLLYRASCFKITKREGESSLLQLHEKFRTYSALRKEHDAQVVQIAMEAGLHISPEQWSALLYGDDDHKSHMQSIIDKLQTPASFSSSIQELIIALQRTQDPADLQQLRKDLELLADIDPKPEAEPPTWEELRNVTTSLRVVVDGLIDFVQNYSNKLKRTMEAQKTPNKKYKTSMCRDVLRRTSCPRGSQCSFAHSTEELERFRKKRTVGQHIVPSSHLDRSDSSSSPDIIGTTNGMDITNGSMESYQPSHPQSDIREASYYKTSNGNYVAPVLNGSHTNAQPMNRANIVNASQVMNGSAIVNGGQIANGARITNGTHLTNGSLASNGGPNHIINGTHVKNGPQMINGAIMQNGSSPFARFGYQRPTTVQTDASVNAIPVTYLQSPVQHIQPTQALQFNGSEQRIDMYCAPYQQNYVQTGVPVYSNGASLLQMSQQYQQFVPQQVYHNPLAVSRSINEKSKDDNDLDKSSEFKGCVSLGISTDNINDYLKLDSGRSSSSLFNSKSDSIWTGNKVRESSIGSGLDTSSEYSSETFSPLSNESCCSPLSSQTQNYGITWNQFESSHSELKEPRGEPRGFSSSHNLLSQKNDRRLSSIWSMQENEQDLFLQRVRKSGSYSKTDRERVHGQGYSGGLWLNSGDTQSSFEEASSDDINSAWSYMDRKPVGAPPGLQQQQQQAPIGTRSTAHYNGRAHERAELPRSQGRHNFSSVSSPDGVAFD